MAFEKMCGSCLGLGHYGSNQADTCELCGGLGRIVLPGSPADYVMCRPCLGLGHYGANPKDICTKCKGPGLVTKSGQAGIWNPKQSHERTTAGMSEKMNPKPIPRTIFVIHGRDKRLRDGMFDFLRSLDLEPLEWIEAVRLTGKGSPYIGEILDAAFSRAQAVVVLLTPDEEVRLRKELCDPGDPKQENDLGFQARPNVLFEAGMALARHPDRTILVEFGNLRPFTDVAGRHTVRMNNSVQARADLATRLRTSGCTLNMRGTDWRTTGDLAAASVSTR
jgi:predicted nucleotide-binding protein